MNFTRYPGSDEYEDQRVQAYWDYINEHSDQIIESTTNRGVFLRRADDHKLYRLYTANDADFEALHMQHSIGYNWGLYSNQGQIFSIRHTGLPQATIMVTNGKVVHAREHQNARLSPELMNVLERFASGFGWEIIPDKYEFDFRSGPGENTRIRYCIRTPEKIFNEVIIPHRIVEDDIAMISSGGRYFDPDVWGLPRIGHGIHELQSIKIVDDKPTYHNANVNSFTRQNSLIFNR